MASEACEALREIHIGRLKISDFAPPEVFSSGLFNQYSLTVADLRWHLSECDECGSSMTVARDQLSDFDLGRLTTLGAALDCFNSALGAQLAGLRDESDSLGELVVRESEWGKGEPAARAGLVGFWSDKVFEENRDRFFLAAIRIHAFLGGCIARWLETLLPPATPRARVVRDHEIVDVWIASDRVDAAKVPDLSSLLTRDEKIAAFLLRSLLVREAFENLAAEPGDRLIEKECAVPKLLEPQTEEIQRLRWRTIWEHYTDLAKMKAERVCRVSGMAGPTDSRIAEKLETLAKKVEAIDERTERLLYGQTAIMASLERLEAAAARLLREYEDASAAVQEACLSRVKRALPVLFERLADDTRRFLEAAEWVHSEAPSGLDQSLVIVGFTKAFDTELWHALEPLRDRLQQLADDRADKNGRRKKPLTEFTLGEWARLLENDTSVLKPLLDKLGLAFSAVLEAIRKVNREVQAKHRGARGEAEATSFRALFLGTPSVLAALCPPSRTD